MSPTLKRLHADFVEFLEQARRKWSVPLLPSDIPAFFLPDFDVRPGDADKFESTPMPYEILWLVLSYAQRFHANVSTAIMSVHGYTDDDGDDALAYSVYARAPSGRWGRLNWDRTPKDSQEFTRMAMELALWRISTHEQYEDESPERDAINRGRAKAQAALPMLPPFISLGGPIGTHRSNGDGTGTHASPIPHDRRGHWRTYKASGKRVWVNDAKIHGGAETARNYAVMS